MTVDLARMTAAREAADRIVREVADHDGSPAPHLMVAVIDPETNTRLATGFTAYTVGPAPLRLVRMSDEHEKVKDPLPIRPPRKHPQG